MSMNVIIAGGGKVGTYLASLLLAGQNQVKVIELRPEHVTLLHQDLPTGITVVGNATNPDILESAGIRGANVVAAVTGADETNLIIANLARFEYKVPRTIARINNPKNAWMFTTQMGVDVALNQADLMGHLIAEEMSLGDMMTLLKLRRGEYSLIEEKIHPGSIAAGCAVRDLGLPIESSLIAVFRQGQLLIPRGDTVLEPADEVLAIVHRSRLNQLALLLGH